MQHTRYRVDQYALVTTTVDSHALNHMSSASQFLQHGFWNASLRANCSSFGLTWLAGWRG
jgi:hypothetical protein